MRRLLLAALTLAAMLGCPASTGSGGTSSSPSPGGTHETKPAPVVPPFLAIVSVKRARVAQPVMMTRGGRTVPVTDFVVVYARFTNSARWLPHGAPGERMMIGSSAATALAIPMDSAAVPLIAAVPAAGSLADATVWTISAMTSVGQLTSEELTALERNAARAGPGSSVPLAPAMKTDPGPWQPFATYAELSASAVRTAATLTKSKSR